LVDLKTDELSGLTNLEGFNIRNSFLQLRNRAIMFG
jgi:hypothetical protein